MAKKNEEVSTVRRAKHGGILTVIFAILSFLWIAPILIVFLNSFKRKAFIFTHPFSLSCYSITEGWDKFKAGITRAFCGWLNYSNGIRKTNLWECFGTSLFITIGSVALIILCCSMCAWYITRVHTKVTKTIYVLCLFSMIVPFQMVMSFTYPTHWESLLFTWDLEQDWRCLCLPDLSKAFHLRLRKQL